MDKKILFEMLDSKASFLNELSDKIWDNPELQFREKTSAEVLIQALLQEGFQVERNIAGIETAFSGSFGNGTPIIGILGEFDALDNMSQEAGVAEYKPILPGGCGHGCGHNNLGVGSLAAAIAIKEYLCATGMSGTVIYFGCPGEEGGSGKAFMAREGVFDKLDCAFSWHPNHSNGVSFGSYLTSFKILYSFKGKAAHAGSAYLGRSALDAVELMYYINFVLQRTIRYRIFMNVLMILREVLR